MDSVIDGLRLPHMTCRAVADLDQMLAYDKEPLDFNRFFASDVESEFVVVNCETGKAEYLSSDGTSESILQICKASCSVPLMCAPVKIGRYHYLDGSICDSIPLERALEQGCDRLVVVMTKSVSETPTNYGKAKAVMAMKYKHKYPNFYKALLERTDVYAKELELLKKLEKEGRAIVLRPGIDCINKFEQDDTKVEAFYQNGRDVATENLDILKEFALNNDKEAQDKEAI